MNTTVIAATTASGSTAPRRRWRQAKNSPIGMPITSGSRSDVAEVLRRPVRAPAPGRRRRSTASARSAVPCSECSASPVTAQSDSAHSSGREPRPAPRTRPAAAPTARATGRGRRARRAPTPPAASARRATSSTSTGAPRRGALRLEQHRADDQGRERGVLVAEQRVALQRRARQHHERRDDADPGREELGRRAGRSATRARRSRAGSATASAGRRRSPNGTASRLTAVSSGCGVGAKSAP